MHHACAYLAFLPTFYRADLNHKVGRASCFAPIPIPALFKMTTDILDPSAVLSKLPQLLPAESKALASPQDGVASLVHAAFTVLAFRLIAIDETSTSINQISSNVLPAGWNAGGPGHYTFKYRHDQSSLEFIVKLSKLGARTLINAIALEASLNNRLLLCTYLYMFRVIKLLPSTYPQMISHPLRFTLTASIPRTPRLLSTGLFLPIESLI